MIPTDWDLCNAASLAYQVAPTWSSGDVCACRTDTDSGVVVAFKGTDPAVLGAWARDLESAPDWRRGLGLLHSGFIRGAESVYAAILADLRGRPAIVTGHSLGGAMALCLGALLCRDGHRCDAVVSFGAPRAGFGQLRRALTGAAVRQYHNGNDPVPAVPWPYQHVAPLIPIGTSLLDPLAAHGIAHYLSNIPDTKS